MLGGQGRAETGIAPLAHLPQGPLPESLRNFPVRAAASQPMHDSAISRSAQPRLQTPDLPVGQSQTPGRFDLLQMTFLDLVQHLQPLSLTYAQADPLLFHWASRPLEKRTFLLCTNRTFSFCGDTSILAVAELP